MPPKRASTKSKSTKGNKKSTPADSGQPGVTFPLDSSVTNLWPLTADVSDLHIKTHMKESFSCQIQDIEADSDTVVINRSTSTEVVGEFSKDSQVWGRIPSHYLQGARLTLFQSVYYLSFLMAGWGQSDEESIIVLGAQRMANYYRNVFLDLVHSASSAT